MGGGGSGGNGGEGGERVDTGLLHDYVRLGVAELVNRSAERAERCAAAGVSTQNRKRGAAIASALSLALCTTNRFMVASHAGVSALSNASSLQRKDDEGIIALMNGGSSGSNDARPAGPQGILSPRALIIQ